jgi:threonine synthase
MKLYSTNNKDLRVTLEEAVMNSLPADKGLYMPTSIPRMPQAFFRQLNALSFKEIAFSVSKNILKDAVPTPVLEDIINQAISFPAPVEMITDRIGSLELFHGPSMAFKDFGARFMSRLMSYFNRDKDHLLTILVATSGDTGGAVAAGFYDTPGIEVIILYPSGKVSDLQEKQLTTLGKNITACEIQGTFDDCQAMVKRAFLDPDLKKNYHLSSANSINIARLVPQSFYYFEAYKQVAHLEKEVVFSVPSGNFGNLTAGLMARHMGLPINRFIAATNVNKVVPEYLELGIYTPKPSIPTISNAMDVGNPSNFVRILDLYNNDIQSIREDMVGYYFTDEETRETMKMVYSNHGYCCDPHGAIGYRALEEYYKSHEEENLVGIFLETAHPAKFLPTVESTLGKSINIPSQLAALVEKKKEARLLDNDYDHFKQFLKERR